MFSNDLAALGEGLKRKKAIPNTSGWLSVISKMALDLFFDTCRFTLTTFHVVKLRSSYFTLFHNLDLIDRRRDNWEDTLNTYSIGYFSNSEGLTVASAPALNYSTLKLLNALFVSFLDFYVNVDSITRVKVRQVFANLCILLLH